MPEWRVKGRQKHASRRDPGLASAVTAVYRFRIPVTGEPHENLARAIYDDDAVDLGDIHTGSVPKLWIPDRMSMRLKHTYMAIGRGIQTQKRPSKLLLGIH